MPHTQFPLQLTIFITMVNLPQLMNQYSFFIYSTKFAEGLFYSSPYAQNMEGASLLFSPVA